MLNFQKKNLSDFISNIFNEIENSINLINENKTNENNNFNKEIDLIKINNENIIKKLNEKINKEKKF